MPLRVCRPCERLFLFEEEPNNSDKACPYCNGAATQPSVRTMRDLPKYRLELVRGETGRGRLGELTERVPA